MDRRSMPPNRLILIGVAAFLLPLLISSVAGANLGNQLFDGDFLAHDPTLIREGDCYYVFSTGHPPYNDGTIMIRRYCSDFPWWELIGTVFDEQPAWIAQELGAKPDNFWAPHISYRNGRYYLYYTAAIPGTNNALIGLATNVTLDPFSPDYEWVDEGMIIRSRSGDNFSAIDPFVFWGEDEAWLLFGVGSNGIKMRRLNPDTGMLDIRDPQIYTIARRVGSSANGGPALLYRNGYYYLIWYFDVCCQGFNSTVNLRVARATEITGPYYDKDGVPTLSGGGTLLLGRGEHPNMAGFTFFLGGAGGPDVYLDGDVWRLIFHWYPEWESHQMSIVDLSWTEDGWPVLGPMR